MGDQIFIYKVTELMDHVNHRWNVPLIIQLFPTDMVKRILETPIRWTMGRDKMWWPHTSYGAFTVKSAYHALKMGERNQQSGPSSCRGIPTTLSYMIWKAMIPQKIKIFL